MSYSEIVEMSRERRLEMGELVTLSLEDMFRIRTALVRNLDQDEPEWALENVALAEYFATVLSHFGRRP